MTTTTTIKTYEDWTGDLGAYLQPGDLVDEEMADYFLEVLPPAYWGPALIQIGEPQDHDGPKHCARYATLQKSRQGWMYTGVQPRGHHTVLAGGAS